MAFPQELIDHIIDQLAQARKHDNSIEASSRKKALMACSLVSKSFLPRSQKHRLFSYLCLKMYHDDEPKILNPLPKIAPYIKNLDHLALRASGYGEIEILRSNLFDVSAMLLQLRSFTLNGFTFRTLNQRTLCRTFWTALGNYRSVSKPLLLSSGLTTLNLENIGDVPPTLFSMCFNLTSLSVKNVSLQPSSSPPEEEAEAGHLSKPRLLALELSWTDSWFSISKDLLERLFPSRAPSMVDLNGLRSLTIELVGRNFKEEDKVAVWDVVRISANTLRHFSLSDWSDEDSGGIQTIALAVDFPIFPALRTLEISFIVDPSGSSLRGLCSTISNSPITLEMLTISIYLGFDRGRDPYDLEWGKLVNVLLRTFRPKPGISHFPIAPHILFKFRYSRLSTFRPRGWKDCVSALVEKEFSKLSDNRNGFKFEYQISPPIYHHTC